MAWTKDGSPVLSQGYFGLFEPELEQWIDDNRLAIEHPNANDPFNPYCGVHTLFHADEQRILKDRESDLWVIVSPYEIALAGSIEVQCDESTDNEQT